MNKNMLFQDAPKTISIMEVGPRDGLQNEKTTVNTADKIQFIESLVAAGVQRIEVTSFVSPKWIPALADHMEVAMGIKREPLVSYAALIANMKGYEMAKEANMDEVGIVISVSNTHNKKNINRTTDEALMLYAEIAERARKDLRPFRAYISCSFGCPYEGEMEPAKVQNLVERMLDLGAYQVSLGDTIGVATPGSTDRLLNVLLAKRKPETFALHMHDTRGRALANITVGLLYGIRAFDSSVGGLGGCPYAPGAAGNVATEDLVSMFNAMNMTTGLSLSHLCEVSLQMEKILAKSSTSKVVMSCR